LFAGFTRTAKNNPTVLDKIGGFATIALDILNVTFIFGVVRGTTGGTQKRETNDERSSG